MIAQVWFFFQTFPYIILLLLVKENQTSEKLTKVKLKKNLDYNHHSLYKLME